MRDIVREEAKVQIIVSETALESLKRDFQRGENRLYIDIVTFNWHMKNKSGNCARLITIKLNFTP